MWAPNAATLPPHPAPALPTGTFHGAKRVHIWGICHSCHQYSHLTVAHVTKELSCLILVMSSSNSHMSTMPDSAVHPSIRKEKG